jgi:hypothetical protein
MKYAPLALVLVAVAGETAPPAVPVAVPIPISRSQPQPHRYHDLRQSLQQYHQAGAPAPRQLSAAERAELRRQLMEYDRPLPPERSALGQPDD